MKNDRSASGNWPFVVLEGTRVLCIGATLLAITSYLPKPTEASSKVAVKRPDLFAPIEGIPSSVSNVPRSVGQMLNGFNGKLALQEMDLQLLEQEGILRNT